MICEKNSQNLDDLIEKAKTLKRLGGLKTHRGYGDLIDLTNFLPDDVGVSRRLWHAIRKDFNVPACVMCDSDAPFSLEKGGFYRKYCSSKCAHIDPKMIAQVKNTNIKKYGYSTPMQHPDIRKRIVDGWIDKYGVDNPSKDDSIRESKRIKMFASRNVNHSNQPNIQVLIDSKLTQKQIGGHLGITQPRVSSLLKNLNMSTSIPSQSTTHADIMKYINGITDVELISNDRSMIAPFELDIYIPSKKIAFEINGVYWHSELSGRDKNYHLNKTKMCGDKNIQLIHVFDYEWNIKPHIVKSRILNLLHATSNRIMARKCSVIEVTSTQAKDFYEQNHIQGNRPTPIRYGLMHNDEIVSMITFSKSTKDCQYELVRFCNKINTVVSGGASKLFAHFKKQHSPESVLSYADRRWGSGQLYSNLGFTFVHNTPPNYWYFYRNGNVNNIYSRNKFQKHKLSNLLEVFDSSKSGWNNMVNNGYDRFWDCGSIKWVWVK